MRGIKAILSFGIKAVGVVALKIQGSVEAGWLECEQEYGLEVLWFHTFRSLTVLPHGARPHLAQVHRVSWPLLRLAEAR